MPNSPKIISWPLSQLTNLSQTGHTEVAWYSTTQARLTPTLVIMPNAGSMHKVAKEIEKITQDNLPLKIFPSWDRLPYTNESPHNYTIQERLHLLYQLIHTQAPPIIITHLYALLTPLPPQDFVTHHSLVIQKNQSLNPTKFCNNLANNGFKRTDITTEPGQFTYKGGIIDIFPMSGQKSYRLEFIDETLENIYLINPENNATIREISNLNILPAKEYILDKPTQNQFRKHWRAQFPDLATDNYNLYTQVSTGKHPQGLENYLPFLHESTVNILDYLPNTTHIVSLDIEKSYTQLNESIQKNYHNYQKNHMRPPIPPTQLFYGIAPCFTTITPDPPTKPKSIPNNLYPDHFDEITQLATTKPCIIASSNPKISKWMQQDQRATVIKSIPTIIDTAEFRPGVYLFNQNLTQGFLNDRIIIITDHEIFPEKLEEATQTSTNNNQLKSLSFSDLVIGDYLVHRDNGIGMFKGFKNIETAPGIRNDFIVLTYAENNTLYVPIEQIHLLSRYFSEEEVQLNHLGRRKWQQATAKAHKIAHDFAANLLKSCAKRQASQSTPLIISSEIEKFGDEFPHQPTHDQITSWTAIYEDLITEKPMDRLLCGDVGFGKTEVAMRASFVVATNQCQTAILAPTTLLAHQHLRNFQERFNNWPFVCACLTNDSSTAEQRDILNNLATGAIDIIIGTHSLLNPKVKFKNLSLVIIDEEHKFGVKHKQVLLTTHPNVNLLSMTATPIPRTLEMGLTKLKDISFIAEPPPGRLKIKTFCQQLTPELISHAVNNEVFRGGGIYYLHNDVATMAKCQDRLQRLFPNLRIGYAHGQLASEQLNKITHKFYDQQLDILICTTIIESGLDIPHANTIIIERTDLLGLAQVYQLRGRVGRRHIQAYAYLCHPDPELLNLKTKRRLAAISKLSELGSGFNLAMQDLELRGCGEILGLKQSGSISQLGSGLFIEMVNEAVSKLTNSAPSLPVCQLDLQIETLIPASYMPNVSERMVIYSKLANLTNHNDLNKIITNLEENYGPPPKATINLISIHKLSVQATILGIATISQRGKNITFTINKSNKINGHKLFTNLAEFGQVRLINPFKFQINLSLPPPEESQKIINQIETIIETLNKN